MVFLSATNQQNYTYRDTNVGILQLMSEKLKTVAVGTEMGKKVVMNTGLLKISQQKLDI